MEQTRMLLGLSGLIGSGKDTAASYLEQHHGFQQMSFASSLKDCVSAVFGWERDLLEGKTQESRVFRETVDLWWSKRLNLPSLTPRWVLQNWGTELFRYHFHDSIWVYSLEKKIHSSIGKIVVTDCRFLNEFQMLKDNGALMVRIQRGKDPEWFSLARTNREHVKQLFPSVHESEYEWASCEFDVVIKNDNGLPELYETLTNLIQDHH